MGNNVFIYILKIGVAVIALPMAIIVGAIVGIMYFMNIWYEAMRADV